MFCIFSDKCSWGQRPSLNYSTISRSSCLLDTVAKWSKDLLVRENRPKNKKILGLPPGLCNLIKIHRSSWALLLCHCSYLPDHWRKQTRQVNNQTKRIIRIHFINFFAAHKKSTWFCFVWGLISKVNGRQSNWERDWFFLLLHKNDKSRFLANQLQSVGERAKRNFSWMRNRFVR